MPSPFWDFWGAILAALGNIAQITQLFVPQRSHKGEASVTVPAVSNSTGVFVTKRRLAMTLILTILSGGLAVYGLLSSRASGPSGPPKETIIATADSNSWGAIRDPKSNALRSMFIDVQVNFVGPKAQSYRMVGITRGAYDRVDGFTDTLIDKSGLFAIIAGPRRIEIPLSAKSVERIKAGHIVDIWVIALPVEFTPEQITSLASLDKLKAVMMIHHAIGVP
jgi:hypothetical protein